ncbi:type VII secretion protein EccB [Saccharopolyspora sp. MS10]|uniref:type VII secretion protein EccB n=1 Tax=Saccharopolyspora sp. MS10 TaxID=3385973 RepID=UPI00399F73A1
MQTQRDHVHAYQFLMGRMSSALVLGDPASPEVPARRASTGVVFGLVLAVLIAIGFGVYGLLVPGGNTAWQARGAIVVEEESGTRFVNVGGVLHPTPNYASAKLLQGPKGGPDVEMLSRASLAAAPRGVPMGIPDAPQNLPAADELLGSSWLACLPEPGAGRDLSLNFDPSAPTAPLRADRYSLVAAEDGAQYLLLGGAKLRVADPAATVALGMAAVRPPVAPRAWLDAVPDGPVLAPAALDGAGSPGPAVDGAAHPVGQLFEQRAANGDVQRFVLRNDGLAPLNGTEFMLLDAVGSTDPVRVGAAAVAAAPRSADRSLTQRLPELSDARWRDPGGDALCLRQRPDGPVVRSEVVFTGSRVGSIPGVHLPPAGGLVVGAVPLPPGQRKPDRYLISEGTKYLLPDDDSMKALGLGGAPVRPFDAALLDEVPSGPPLSTASAGAIRKG